MYVCTSDCFISSASLAALLGFLVSRRANSLLINSDSLDSTLLVGYFCLEKLLKFQNTLENTLENCFM